MLCVDGNRERKKYIVRTLHPDFTAYLQKNDGIAAHFFLSLSRCAVLLLLLLLVLYFFLLSIFPLVLSCIRVWCFF